MKTLETMFDKISPGSDIIELAKKRMESASLPGRKKPYTNVPSFKIVLAACLAIIFTATFVIFNMSKPAAYNGYFTAKEGFHEISDSGISILSEPNDSGAFLQEGLKAPGPGDEGSISEFQDEFKNFAVSASGDACSILVLQGRVISSKTYAANDINTYGLFGFHMIRLEITGISFAENSSVKYRRGDFITAFYYVKDQSQMGSSLADGGIYSMYLYTGKNGSPTDSIGQFIGIRNSWILSAAFKLDSGK